MGKLAQKLANNEVYFIAEMSANHGNDLERALSIVDAAADAGADCLKVQTYSADSLTIDCDNELFRIEGGLWDGRKLYDLYSEGSLPKEWHLPIKDRCEALGMDFLSTPFDFDAVDFLCELGVNAFKIASFELVDIPLIKYAASKGKPMIMSTGMATVDEIQEAVDAARDTGSDDITLLKCCSEYPANYADMNLSCIPDMAKRFGCKIGFSDHSEGYLADVVAASVGATVIEKHIYIPGTETIDSGFSMTPDEYRAMVDNVNLATVALGSPVYGPSDEEIPSLRFRRSIFACEDIHEGEPFTNENIRVIRPSSGAHPRYYDELLGTNADRDYSFGDPIIYQEQ